MNSVFDVQLEGWSLEEALTRAEEHAPFWIVTANPEILLEAKRDTMYKQTLMQANVRLVDGFGLWVALWLQGARMHRVAGIDLAEELVACASREGEKVALIGGGTTHEAGNRLRERYSSLILHTEEAGIIHADGTFDEKTEDAMMRMTIFAPEILLVGFGHPKQERWIANNLHQFPSVKCVVGVGGAFDVWSGKIPRAPKLFRAIGLEWLWRLFQEPKRIRRIWNAVFVFPCTWLSSYFHS